MHCPRRGAGNANALERCESRGARVGVEVLHQAATRIGMSQNKAAALSYLLGWITGLVFIKLEKENEYVRFHAMQSIVVFGGLTWAVAVAFSVSLLLIEVPNLGVIVWLYWVIFTWVWVLLIGILWIFLMVKACRGNRYKLRWAGNLAEKYL